MANAQPNQQQLGGSVISRNVATKLLDEMKTGCFQTETRLPAEIELAERLAVSRTVIRDALSELEREGYLERVRGIGTVINRRVVNQNNRLDQKFEYNHMIRKAGYTPHADQVKVRHELATPELAQALNLSENAPILVIEKRVLADHKPVIWSTDYISTAYFPPAVLQRVDFSCPIYDVLEQTGNPIIHSTSASLRAVMGEDRVRKILLSQESDALLMLKEVHFSRLAEPVFYSIAYYTNFFDFSIFRKKF